MKEEYKDSHRKVRITITENTSQTGVEDQEIEALQLLSSLLCEFADAAERGEIEFADRDAVGDVREENGVFALQLCDESIASGGRALKRSAGHQNGTGTAPQQTLHGLVADPSTETSSLSYTHRPNRWRTHLQ